MISIHPTAIVDPQAKLAEGVSVGPFTIIGARVSIGARTKVASHCVIDGKVSIGADNVLFPSVFIGLNPQDKKFKECNSGVVIGERNTIRENVTIHPATVENSNTVIGDDNLIMINAHVAHDCRVGNRCVIVNNVAIGGFVSVDDCVTIGGQTGAHQFTRVGAYAMVGGVSKITQDVLPYSLCDGRPLYCRGINSVGLRRSGFKFEDIRAIKSMIKTLTASGLSTQSALGKIEQEYPLNPYKDIIKEFVLLSKRGYIKARFGKAVNNSDDAFID